MREKECVYECESERERERERERECVWYSLFYIAVILKIWLVRATFLQSLAPDQTHLPVIF